MSQDSQLQQSVLAEFGWEPSVTAGHIGVTATDGVGTLSGHVDSYAKKQEAAARRVKGVKAVVEEIEVRLPYDTKRSDEEIADAAIARLSWNVSVPKDSVQVKVEKGWVTLTGQVDWWHQKDAVEQDIRPLHRVASKDDLSAARSRLDDVVDWLGRHGVAADMHARPTTGDDAAGLDVVANQHDADNIVAGAYGHSRLREWALGGITRTCCDTLSDPRSSRTDRLRP